MSHFFFYFLILDLFGYDIAQMPFFDGVFALPVVYSLAGYLRGVFIKHKVLAFYIIFYAGRQALFRPVFFKHNFIAFASCFCPGLLAFFGHIFLLHIEIAFCLIRYILILAFFGHIHFSHYLITIRGSASPGLLAFYRELISRIFFRPAVFFKHKFFAGFHC